MKLAARLIIMVTIVVTATDLIEYLHLKQHPERLTAPIYFISDRRDIGPDRDNYLVLAQKKMVVEGHHETCR